MFSADTAHVRAGLMVMALVSVTGGLTGCKPHSYEQSQAAPPRLQEQFLTDLANEYQVLGDFIGEQSTAPLPSSVFYDKARRATKGEKVAPADLTDYQVPAFAVHDLMKARQSLVTALDTVNVPDNARMLAMAQVKFDCWLAFQPYQKSAQGYIGCREAFRQAMANIDFSKKSTTSLASRGSSNRQTIRFRDETITLDQPSHDIIEKVATAALTTEGSQVVLTGHAKGKVTIEDTSNNAVRRIIAVRNALYQNGVDPDAVETRFESGGSALDVDIEMRYGGPST